MHFDGPDQPAHICSFGGTQGHHNSGTFLPYASCYDRVRERWHFPFGKLPFGFDHGGLARIPAGTCRPDDPERILIFDFRTQCYGTASSSFLAYDLPSKWEEEDLEHLELPETVGPWYTYADVGSESTEDEVNTSRDASGTVLANEGRHIFNFAGIHYYYPFPNNPTKYRGTKFSTVRRFDVCQKEWEKVGNIGGDGTFALQSCASSKLNVAITCGGQTSRLGKCSPLERESEWSPQFLTVVVFFFFSGHAHKNREDCTVNRFPDVQFMNDPNCVGLKDEGFEAF